MFLQQSREPAPASERRSFCIMPGPTMELREEVIVALNARYPALKKLYGVKKIGIFGSLARGDEHPGSLSISRRRCSVSFNVHSTRGLPHRYGPWSWTI